MSHIEMDPIPEVPITDDNENDNHNNNHNHNNNDDDLIITTTTTADEEQQQTIIEATTTTGHNGDSTVIHVEPPPDAIIEVSTSQAQFNDDENENDENDEDDIENDNNHHVHQQTAEQPVKKKSRMGRSFRSLSQRFKSQNIGRPPIQLEWKDLYFEVMVRADTPQDANPLTKVRYLFKKEKRTILYPMTGHVAPGECLAIMGPSGAGKTSLLNILARRVKAKGEITVNGQQIGKSFGSLSAFVQQDDVLSGTLTVRETLRYAALLRLGNDVSLREKQRRVLRVAEELGLTKCLDTYVGVPGVSKGISGGERKRLAIAIELLSEPSLLFLDEPTSGLDAKTAKDVITAIRKLAQGGRAVVMTIHQPRSDIYKLFDKLLLLARGRVAYFGDANKATSYFTQLKSLDPEKKPDMFKCPSDFNPADFFIDLITESTSSSPEERQLDNNRINYILDYYSDRYVYEKPTLDQELDPNLKKYGAYKSMWIVQLAVLTFRSLVSIMRDKMLTNARIFQSLSMALVMGLLYLRLDRSQSSVQNRIGVLFFALNFSIMGSLFGSLSTFVTAERPVFMRERSAKAYRVSSYYLGKVFAETPSNFLFPPLMGVIMYWMVGLNPKASAFFTFIFLVIVISMTAQAMGLLIASIVPSLEVAQAITPIVLTLFMLFGGFYLNVKNIPDWLIWVYWMSVYHFGFEALVINEFQDTTFNCNTQPCLYPNGNAVIKNFGMDQPLSNIWINVAFLFVIIIVCRTLAYIVIRIKKPKGG